MEYPTQSMQESEMQCLDAVSKTTAWSLFVSKANHSKSMPQSLMPKKMKLNSSMNTYLQDFLELIPKKDILFIIGDWNAKVGSQDIPGVTSKFGLGVQNEAGQRLIEFCQDNALVTANTLFQQPKRRLYTWTSPDDQYWNQIDYILCSQRWRSSIQSAKARLGADCGSSHELLIAKFRLKLKKVGKTTWPFKYDLNQIPYDYTMEVTNRFKGLDLIQCLKNYGWGFMTLYRSSDRDHPQEKEMQKGKMVVWGCLTNNWEKKRS